MITWINDNKEWLFSGAGISAITLIIYLFSKWKNRPTHSVNGAAEAIEVSSQNSDLASPTIPAALTPTVEPPPLREQSLLSLTEILSGLDKEAHTDLQVAQFVKRVSGCVIEFKVQVKSVSPSAVAGDSDLWVCFEDPEDQTHLPETCLAVFDRCREIELTPISENDIIVIRGELKATDSPATFPVVLYNSKIVVKTGA